MRPRTCVGTWECGGLLGLRAGAEGALLRVRQGRAYSYSCFALVQDRFSKDDLLGTARGVLLEPYLDAKTPEDFVLPLTHQGASAGSLMVSARWFELSSRPPKSLDGAIARGPSQLLLVVKLLGEASLKRHFKPSEV